MTLRMEVQPGDLILVKSRGWVFAAARKVMASAYDHVAVVVGEGRTLNIDKPRSRFLPVERLLRDSLEPLVLRPAWPSIEARDAFVRWISQLAGLDYDVRRTLRLLASLFVKRAMRRAWPLHPPAVGQSKWICTDAVLLGLERYADAGPELRALPIDWNRLRCGTTNDFLVIAEAAPQVLRRLPQSP